jgi:hypothetical protein
MAARGPATVVVVTSPSPSSPSSHSPNNVSTAVPVSSSYPPSSPYPAGTASIYAIPVEEDYAIPVYAQSVQPISPNHPPHSSSSTPTAAQPATIYLNTISLPRQRITVHLPHDQMNLSENILSLYALSRTIKCLVIIDLLSIILSSIFNLFWLFFLWGPVTGYFGILKHHLYFVYCYVVYWILRILFDLLYILTGHWWYLLSLIVDLYILRYLRMYLRAYKRMSYEELEILRDLQSNSQRYEEGQGDGGGGGGGGGGRDMTTGYFVRNP